MVSRNYLKYLHKSQANYMEINQRLASGNRFTKLSDDVSAGSRVLRARMDRYKAEKQMENAKEALETLKGAEDSLRAINDRITDILEHRAIKALNDPTGDFGQDILAREIQSMMDEILQYANNVYGKKFSFGGTNAWTAPFVVDADTGKLRYNGVDMDSIRWVPDLVDPSDPGAGTLDTGRYMGLDTKGDLVKVPMDDDIYYDIGLGIKIPKTEVVSTTAFRLSYSGPEVFGFGVDDLGISSNIYNVLAEIQKGILDFDREHVETWHTKLHTLADKYRANLTDIGTRTRFLDSMVGRLTNQIDNHTEKIFNLMGVDDAEEATNQMMNDYVYKAVLQLGSRMLPLSLMDFIR